MQKANSFGWGRSDNVYRLNINSVIGALMDEDSNKLISKFDCLGDFNHPVNGQKGHVVLKFRDQYQFYDLFIPFLTPSTMYVALEFLSSMIVKYRIEFSNAAVINIIHKGFSDGDAHFHSELHISYDQLITTHLDEKIA
jgi:hypothetical protein